MDKREIREISCPWDSVYDIGLERLFRTSVNRKPIRSLTEIEIFRFLTFVTIHVLFPRFELDTYEANRRIR